MLVRAHDDAVAFLIAADPFFRSDPFSANVIAVVAARVAAGDQIGGRERIMATVEDTDGNVLGVAMQTPPHPYSCPGCRGGPLLPWPTRWRKRAGICPA